MTLIFRGSMLDRREDGSPCRARAGHWQDDRPDDALHRARAAHAPRAVWGAQASRHLDVCRLLDRTAPGRNLTPVMARLDPRDVEVLDALITVGIVPNRAEGVRWALTRIRERPAYTQFREHIGKIDELKAQL